MILLATACSGSLSNEIFYEDVDFLGALPNGEDLAVSYPGEPILDSDDALYFRTTVDTMQGFSDWSVLISTVTDTVRAVPPSLRGDDLRVWGPGAWDAYPGSFLRLEMSRTSDRGLYVWTFQASEFSDGPWTEFMSGTSRVDSEWDVELEWDQNTLDDAVESGGSGALEMAYVVDEDGMLTVALEARGLRSAYGAAQSTRMWLQSPEDGSGEFQLAQQMDANPGETLAIDENVELVTRWDSAGLGRADGTVDGGDYPYPGLVLTQCWTADGALTFQADTEGVLPAEGSEDDCPFDDIAGADEL